jgi:hypothetical protein
MRILPCVMLSCVAAAVLFAAEEARLARQAPLSVDALEEQAQKRVGAKARVDLAAETSEAFLDLEPILPSEQRASSELRAGRRDAEGRPGWIRAHGEDIHLCGNH